MAIQVPEYITNLHPYVPGKPIEETKREFGLDQVIKLASNENPLGPSPKALEAAAKAVNQVHRYPDGSCHELRVKLADKLGIPGEEILFGNGSNEVLEYFIRTFCTVGDSIATSKAAFIAYRIAAQAHGVRTLESELLEDGRFDLDAIALTVENDERCKIVFIANPNNPTGTYVGESDLRKFLGRVSEVRGRSIVTVLDYAYWDYVTAEDLPDPYKLQKEFPNIVVLRTFSKIYGLAGLRLGYGTGNIDIVGPTQKVREVFNVNIPAMDAGVAALDDQDFVKKSIDLNNQSKTFWYKELDAMGVPYWPSQGNFVLVDTQKGFGKSGIEIFGESLKKGVIFRPIANYQMPDKMRISFGTMEENIEAAKVLQEVGRGK